MTVSKCSALDWIQSYFSSLKQESCFRIPGLLCDMNQSVLNGNDRDFLQKYTPNVNQKR